MRRQCVLLVARLASALLVPKSAPCLYHGRICRWHGESPICGRDSHRLGFSTSQQELMASTRYASISALCSDDADGLNPGPDCCAQYGKGCVAGYKRLWCHVEPVVKTQSQTVRHTARGSGQLCEWEGRKCQWYGAAPFCMATEHEIGSVDDKGREFLVSTRYMSVATLCSDATRPTDGHCCSRYGKGCLGGYKRLWCFPKPTTRLKSSHHGQASLAEQHHPSPVPLPPPDWASRRPCRFRGRTCQWHGSSPFCGTTSSPLGQTDALNQTLLFTTRETPIAHLCANLDAADYPGESCCREYHATCWTGYKRLWCSEERPEAYWETDAWRYGKL
ncbi:hypothetical protein CDD82_5206 [Ophiocordyceps australis]|uniref:Uncharacterized protein n=1 Tax=Ophiocordyceps australis TaxID=1399860 RepID=A0A2C5ZRP3_9HYPO|nr:hypothetical protein CDD82_5206 [Ophiocordyceps australis]